MMGVDPPGLKALPARAPGCSSSDGGPSAPLTGSLLPREQCCHQGAARAPPHLVPFETNRYIMRLLVLSSLCPCSIKAPSVQMCWPLVVPPACLHVYCPFYFTYANLECVMSFFTCTIKVHFVFCWDVTVHYGKTVVKQYIFAPGVDRESEGINWITGTRCAALTTTIYRFNIKE